ncbi:Guanylate kinase [Lacunisphaera limnophila]|uniref:Guanylate kinase n=1 Tax=Lacunisphaera limnophila TaxID=1838286 RepID=A0A1D8AT07_9BACT|nr:guanylate kinase [Lacunisphaera limnophila]AOS44038.1 Guanylate kinase [Lacunisphaera limnophila]
MAVVPHGLIILAGPAGVGKSTLCDRLVAEAPQFERVVTATTRPPRPNEVNGRDYHFLSEAEFDLRQQAGEFLEWACVHRKYRYGTLKSAVLGRLPETNLVMNIDVQGVRSIRAAAAQIPLLQRCLVTIFIAPDSLDVLRERLEGRGPLPAEELARRMQSAELELADRFSYDYIIHSSTKEQDFRALLDYWAQAQARLGGT